jgi:hypothetical protein
MIYIYKRYVQLVAIKAEALSILHIRNTHIPKHITQKSFNFTRNLSVFANLLMIILNRKERHLLDWTYSHPLFIVYQCISYRCGSN